MFTLCLETMKDSTFLTNRPFHLFFAFKHVVKFIGVEESGKCYTGNTDLPTIRAEPAKLHS